MKKIINTLWSIFDSIGTARAATLLARQHRVEEAKALYTK
jgi:hypothetical protein